MDAFTEKFKKNLDLDSKKISRHIVKNKFESSLVVISINPYGFLPESLRANMPVKFKYFNARA